MNGAWRNTTTATLMDRKEEKDMRYLLLAFALLLSYPATARVDISIGINVPGIDIGINMPAYPRLVRVPGYPVYYGPDLGLNFFFYDGLYWVFTDDDWFAASWYNGPWRRVERGHVPLYVLRVPVRYYRRPPPYFHGWHVDAAPRWDEHWGKGWREHRGDWDRWDRHNMPSPAPLPNYQRQYKGDRYPFDDDHQQRIERERYRYEPRDDNSRRYGPPGKEKRGNSHRDDHDKGHPRD